MSDVGRYRSNWQDEIDSAALYRSLAEAERQSRLSEIYLKLADAEERRSAFRAEKLRAAGVAVPRRVPGGARVG